MLTIAQKTIFFFIVWNPLLTCKVTKKSASDTNLTSLVRQSLGTRHWDRREAGTSTMKYPTFFIWNRLVVFGSQLSTFGSQNWKSYWFFNFDVPISRKHIKLNFFFLIPFCIVWWLFGSLILTFGSQNCSQDRIFKNINQHSNFLISEFYLRQSIRNR